MKYLTKSIAQQIDVHLMSKGGFSIDQLMELAGLSVAQSIYKVYPQIQYSKILVCVGPGNNGGDGLVAARHLAQWGYQPSIYYPKPNSKTLFTNLVTQCHGLNLLFIHDLKDIKDYDLILDGIFGFSFKGEVRSPFKEILEVMKQSSVPIVSIDIPSGWDVEQGNVNGDGLQPEMLISLTWPKESARFFSGRYHYLGGRFVPKDIASEYNINATYPGCDQCVLFPLHS